MMVAQALSYSDDSKLAVQAYRDMGDILSKSTDPKVTKLTDRFAGVIRRLTLPGHPIELKGTLVGGKPFDQDSLKGKVVLVDFWATWCGPCRAELPNVVKNYKKYHDKGFEVVGISLDDDRDKLEKVPHRRRKDHLADHLRRRRRAARLARIDRDVLRRERDSRDDPRQSKGRGRVVECPRRETQ